MDAEPRKSNSAAAQKRAELGKYTISEAARAMSRPRSYVRSLVDRGELDRDENGWVDVQEVEDLAEEMVVKADDPAVSYLVKAFERTMDHHNTMQDKLVAAISMALDAVRMENDAMRGALKESRDAEVQVWTVFRELQDNKQEREIELMGEKAKADATQQFVDVAQLGVQRLIQDKTISGRLQQFAGGLREDQLLKLATVLDEGQLGDLQQLVQATQLQGVEESPDEQQAAPAE